MYGTLFEHQMLVTLFIVNYNVAKLLKLPWI